MPDTHNLGNQQDIKNTAIGRQNAEEYADIINMERPEPIHPRMDLVRRAKIFKPFDALRGYDEAIEAVNERGREVKRPELSEEQLGVLSQKLQQVKRGMKVTLTVFQPGSSENSGKIVDLSGTVGRIDTVCRRISIATEHRTSSGIIEKDLPTVIRFEDLLDIHSPDIRDVDLFLDEDGE